MGIENPTNFDLHTAGLAGMGNMHGDPEALEDIGIPATPETFDSHLASATAAKHILQHLAVAETPQLTPRDAAWQEMHDFYVRTHGVMDGPLTFPTPEEKSANTAGANAAKAKIEPTRFNTK